MSLSNIERETIVLFNEEEAMAEVYTHSIKLKNRFDKFLEKHPKLITKKDENTFILDKKLLRIMPVSPMSEEGREKIRKIGNANKNNLRKRQS